MKSIIIVNNSLNGYASGYAAWKKYGNDAVYFVYRGEQPPTDIDKCTKVYLLDFSYPEEVMTDIANKSAYVTVIINNKTDVLTERLGFITKENTTCLDHDSSSCVTAWQHFHVKNKAPKPLLLVQDIALESYSMRDSRDFLEGMIVEGYKDGYLQWDLISQDDYFLNILINKGRIINVYKENVVDEFVKTHKPQYVNYGNLRAALFNSTNFTTEIADRILDTIPDVDFTVGYQILDSGIYFDFKSRDDRNLSINGRQVDLKSKKDYNLSMLVLAAKYGGSGDENNANCIRSSDTPSHANINSIIAGLLSID